MALSVDNHGSFNYIRRMNAGRRECGVFGACILVATLFFPAGAHAAPVTLTGTVSCDSTVTVVNQYFTLSFAVTNTSSVSVIVFAMTMQGPTTGDVGWTGNMWAGQVLAPGAAHTYQIHVLARQAGTYTFQFSASASEYGGSTGGGTGTKSVTVTVGSPSAAYGKAVPRGKMEIRRAIIRRTGGDIEVGRPSAAFIVVHGEPGGGVEFVVSTLSGRGLGRIRPMLVYQGNTDSRLTLDGNGMGAVSFDGELENGGYLEPGVYWIVASGAVNDRKPILFLSKEY